MDLTEEQQAEVLRIRDEERWPNWPVLPVKERGGERRIGVIFTGSATVWLVNMFSLHTLSGEQLKHVPCLAFDSVEDLVRAGWAGD